MHQFQSPTGALPNSRIGQPVEPVTQSDWGLRRTRWPVGLDWCIPNRRKPIANNGTLIIMEHRWIILQQVHLESYLNGLSLASRKAFQTWVFHIDSTNNYGWNNTKTGLAYWDCSCYYCHCYVPTNNHTEIVHHFDTRMLFCNDTLIIFRQFQQTETSYWL